MLDDTNQFLEAFKAGPPLELGPLIDKQTSPEESGGLPDLFSAGSLPPKAEIPLPPPLIHGVLHQGAKMILAGGSKSYKTWSLIDLAISVAGGSPWWGWDCVRQPVFYLNLELQEGWFKHRVWDISNAKKRTSPPDDLMLWQLRGKSYDIMTIRTALDQQMQKFGIKPGLLVIDPVYKLFAGGNENDAGEVTSFMEEIEAFTIETGAAVAYGHHFSKGNQADKEPMDRISGSGVYARDPDCILTMTKHAKDDHFTTQATLRDNPPISDFVVEWDFPLFKRSTLSPSDLKKPGQATSFVDKDLLSKLKGEMSNSQWQMECGELCGERTYRKKRDQLVLSGAVRRWEENGITYFSPRSSGQ